MKLIRFAALAAAAVLVWWAGAFLSRPQEYFPKQDSASDQPAASARPITAKETVRFGEWLIRERFLEPDPVDGYVRSEKWLETQATNTGARRISLFGVTVSYLDGKFVPLKEESSTAFGAYGEKSLEPGQTVQIRVPVPELPATWGGIFQIDLGKIEYDS